MTFVSRKNQVINVKTVKTLAMTAVINLILFQQSFAQDQPPGGGGGGDPIGGVAVPEMDGAGAILAIGLVVGLVALFREKFR